MALFLIWRSNSIYWCIYQAKSNESQCQFRAQTTMEKVAPNSKFVGHSTLIIRQSKIKGPLTWITVNPSRVSDDLNSSRLIVEKAEEGIGITFFGRAESHVVPLTLCPECLVHPYQVQEHLVHIGQKLWAVVVVPSWGSSYVILCSCCFRTFNMRSVYHYHSEGGNNIP